MCFNNFFNLVLVCKELETRYGRTRTRGFFSNFSLPPKYLDFGDYLVNFELFYRNIRDLSILSNEDLDFVKTSKKKQPSLIIETIITMYCNIFLKKSFLFYKIYVKMKIS